MYLNPRTYRKALKAAQKSLDRFKRGLEKNMPHDSKGQLLKSGDRVVVRAVVKDVFEGQEACNVNLEVVGDAEYHPMISCNSKLCEKVGEKEETVAQAARKGYESR